MDEEEYHRYMSEQHAASVTDLMVQKKIIAYTMVRSLFSQPSSTALRTKMEAPTEPLDSNTTQMKPRR
jgi:EthD domain